MKIQRAKLFTQIETKLRNLELGLPAKRKDLKQCEIWQNNRQRDQQNTAQSIHRPINEWHLVYEDRVLVKKMIF